MSAGLNMEFLTQKKHFGLSPRDFRCAAFLLILAVGLYVRIDDFREWIAKPSLAFFDGRPLPCETDSYYYLRLARDIQEGTYTQPDTLRHGIPAVSRPEPAPLLSVLTAAISGLAGLEIEWVAAFLPACLGLLLAFPLYGFGRHFCGIIAGLVSALMGLLSPLYVYRSGMGWFDTDCMNVTWSTSVAFCFLKFGTCKTFFRYAWLGAGCAAAALFYWWWDQSPESVFAITMIPFTAAVLFLFRPKGRGDLIVLIMCGVLLAAVCLWQKDGIVAIANKIILKAPQRYSQIAKVADQVFPAQSVSTSEQKPSSLDYAIDATTRSMPFFFMGVLGFFWILCRRFKEIVVLSALILLSVFSFLFAERFLIFLSPLVAIGLGVFVSFLWSGKDRFFTMIEKVGTIFVRLPGSQKTTGPRSFHAGVVMRSVTASAACAVLTAAMAWTPFYCLVTGLTSFQKIDGKRAAGMAEVQSLTPDDAVIWAWWDNGHAISYLGRRKTVIDAARHGRQYSVYNALPFAVRDERLAANFIRFYAIRGFDGLNLVTQAAGGQKEGLQFIKKVLALGPEQAGPFISSTRLHPVGHLINTPSWLSFLFPAKTHPVYLYLDNLSIVTAYWWYWYGTWDPDRQDGVHPYYEPFFGVTFREDNRDAVIHGIRGLKIFPRSGIASLAEGMVPLSHILVRTETETLKRRYKHPEDSYVFELAAAARLGIMMGKDISESVFNRLFVRVDTGMKYFKPVDLKTPYYQLWEVHGDESG